MANLRELEQNIELAKARAAKAEDNLRVAEDEIEDAELALYEAKVSEEDGRSATRTDG